MQRLYYSTRVLQERRQSVYHKNILLEKEESLLLKEFTTPERELRVDYKREDKSYTTLSMH